MRFVNRTNWGPPIFDFFSSNVATNEEQDFFSNVATNEEEDENGIRLQMKPVKSYTRAKPINSSITASPPKKMKKKVLFPLTVFIPEKNLKTY